MASVPAHDPLAFATSPPGPAPPGFVPDPSLPAHFSWRHNAMCTAIQWLVAVFRRPTQGARDSPVTDASPSVDWMAPGELPTCPTAMSFDQWVDLNA